MNEKIFMEHYPARKDDSNKFDNGVTCFVSGSRGMAGAAILNLMGARAVGASYIHSFLPACVYPIAAAREITCVYHPYDEEERDLFSSASFLKKVKAIGFGSGLNNAKHSHDYLKWLLPNTDVPIIIDAHGLDLLSDDESLYGLHDRMILTPHMGEFARLCHLDLSKIEKDREAIAKEFSSSHHVTLVLKGPETAVFCKDGTVRYNDSGNSALARAGSGDVLTGMITGLCSLYDDCDTAVSDAVWLHGFLCDEAMKHHSKEVFDLCSYPELADRFFFENR